MLHVSCCTFVLLWESRLKRSWGKFRSIFVENFVPRNRYFVQTSFCRRALWSADGATGPGISKQLKWRKDDPKMTFQGRGESDSKMTQNLTFPEKSHFRSHSWVTFPGASRVIFESPIMSFLGPGSVAQRRFTRCATQRKVNGENEFRVKQMQIAKKGDSLAIWMAALAPKVL